MDYSKPTDKQKEGIPSTGHYGAAQNTKSAKTSYSDNTGFKFIATATHTGDKVSELIGQNTDNSKLNIEKYGDTNPHSNYECKDLDGAKCGETLR